VRFGTASAAKIASGVFQYFTAADCAPFVLHTVISKWYRMVAMTRPPFRRLPFALNARFGFNNFKPVEAIKRLRRAGRWTLLFPLCSLH
jgi:hypothetical protein